MIYFDNAATSFPKPPQVARAMAGTLEKLGANPGRSGHRLSLCAGVSSTLAGRRTRCCWAWSSLSA